MADDPNVVVARARRCLGVPFRLQGRDASGLDCVGLVALAYRLTDGVPADYRLRGTDVASAVALLDARLCRRAGAVSEAGDVLLVTPGPAQLHLGIWTGTGLVHAHAGLRRVVETPGLPGGLIGIWHSRKDVSWQHYC